MLHIYDVFLRALPIFIMIGIGMLLRISKVLNEDVIPEIKKLIVQVTLPSMLLVTFARTRLRAEYMVIFTAVFLFCCLMLCLGMLFRSKINPKNRFLPALFTGFEAGMMGYALFSSFFGEESTYAFAVVDIGQVLFVFFVLAFFLRKQSGADVPFRTIIRDFALSPVILSIVAGILLSGTGIYTSIDGFALTVTIEDTLVMVGAVTQPLICIVIGYDLRLRVSRIIKPLSLIVIRLTIMLAAAYAINSLLIDRILGLEPVFHTAVYTMFLLPPPFVIPVYIGKASGNEKEEIMDTLSLHIIVSLFAFIVLLWII